MRIVCLTFMFLAAWVAGLPPASATADKPCGGEDQACLFDMLETTTAAVTERQWQDSTWREMAKLLTQAGQTDRALTLIDKIENPDTRAMTIRGIGMAAAERKFSSSQYDKLFEQLTAEAAKIDHPPSHAIALTYIAMAQAFAGDDEGAMKTAAGMENDALRHKAYGETAEIQAERGDYTAARASLDAIDSIAFRDKASRTVSKIFAERSLYDDALATALGIDNAYQKAQSVLYILVRQISPEEVSVE